jgi:co-chaperonin GroES (HSP10)
MITPKNGYAIIEKIDNTNAEGIETTKGGILMVRQQETPDSHIAVGKVISSAPKYEVKDYPDQDSELSPGDYILYFKPAAQHIFKENDQQFALVREIDILAIIDEEDLKRIR